MNRFDRVTAILIQLQSKKVVKAQDIAERFGISLRTVYRDVHTLEEAGIPIIGEAGVGYSIMDGYRLPPVMFTKEEAIAFLTAEKFMEKWTDDATEARFKSAMYKVRSVLRTVEKDALEDLESLITVRQQYAPFTVANSNALDLLLKSISEKKIARIHYKAAYKEEITERNIEPIGIFHDYGYWHTIAFCYTRHDYRHFRADRIQQVLLTDQPFNEGHLSLPQYLEQVKNNQIKSQLETIIIRVNKETVKYLNCQKHQYGFVSEIENEDSIEMTFLSISLEGFARWFLMFADMAQIVAPNTLKERVKNIVLKINTML